MFNMHLKLMLMTGITVLCKILTVNDLHAYNVQSNNHTIPAEVQPTTVKAPTESEFRQCIQQMTNTLGRYEIVAQALSLYRAPQSQWSPIALAFQRNLRELNSRFQAAATKHVPNPFRPYNPNVLQQVLQATLLEIWSESLSIAKAVNSSTPPSATIPMLEYIIRHQPDNIRHCLMDVFEEPQVPATSSKIGKTQQWR
jgi:hypothetical protein